MDKFYLDWPKGAPTALLSLHAIISMQIRTMEKQKPPFASSFPQGLNRRDNLTPLIPSPSTRSKPKPSICTSPSAISLAPSIFRKQFFGPTSRPVSRP